MAAVERVLVVGAGISGMVLATALKNAGKTPDIVEIHPQWDVLGVGISIQGPALRALRSIGVLDRCVHEGFGYSQVVNCDQDGKVEGIVDLPRLNGAQYPSCVGMMRPSLHRILAEALAEAGVAVRFGLTVHSMRQSPDRVEVAFSDGTRGKYDLVVGADGANSRIRELVFGLECRPQYTGQAVWRAMVPRPEEVSARHAYYGPRHKAGFNPVSAREMYIYLVQNVTGNPRLEPERWPAVMRELLADFGGRIGEVRDRITDPRRIVYRPVGSLLLPPPWYAGRVLVIGDAAHAAPPQLASGATVAIEDAIVLAELVQSGQPAPEILGRFMARRYQRCRIVVENSRQLGEWEKFPDTPGADPTALISASMKALAAPI
ncbi:MAG TPA: FAD-dependent oxidoreductase [Burkholderiales bacterium]|nr:FAD-dependent oxidoreductase [Burkholderiales bacterium]